jgi:hypothetical protein
MRLLRYAPLPAAAALAAGLALAAPASAQPGFTDTAVAAAGPLSFASLGCLSIRTPHGPAQLQFSGAPSPGAELRWRIAEDLPPAVDGLTINGAGVVTDPDTADAGTFPVRFRLEDTSGLAADAVAVVQVTAGDVALTAGVSANCVAAGAPENIPAGVLFRAVDTSSGVAGPPFRWATENLPAGLAPIRGDGLLPAQGGVAPPGFYPGVRVLVTDASGSVASVTFTLHVTAEPVAVAPSAGDEVNRFGNGFDVYQQHWVPGAIIVGWTATAADPATRFIRIPRGPAAFSYEAVNAAGVATGLCVTDPGPPDGLILAPCTANPDQVFAYTSGGPQPSELRNAATGLLVSPGGTGVQLAGTPDPAARCPSCSAFYTWLATPQLP